MKLICTAENFKKAISNTERVAGKQISLPILENILIETGKGVMRVSATNLEIGVVLEVGAKIEKEGKITVPARLIGNYVSNLPLMETVSLEVVDSVLRISSGKYKAGIKGLDARDFPIIPEQEGETLFSLSAGSFKNSVPKILPCASTDNTRPELSGVNVIFSENEVSLAATDSFRLAEATLPIMKEKNYELFISKVPSVIIPAVTLAEVLRIASDEEENIGIAIEESQIFFQAGPVKIVSRLINGKYPEYRHIIPREFSTEAVVLKDEIARSVKLASIFTSSKAGEVSLSLEAKRIVVEARSVEVGENKTEIEAAIKGGNEKIVFNPRYLLDGISSIGTNAIFFQMNSGSSPAVLRMTDKSGKAPAPEYTYVIMPIKN